MGRGAKQGGQGGCAISLLFRICNPKIVKQDNTLEVYHVLFRICNPKTRNMEFSNK
jgi:hypothetical protein